MALIPERVLLNGWNLFKNSAENIRSSYNALKTITFEHERIHAGKMFHHADVSTLAAAASNTMLISVSSVSNVHLRAISFVANVGVCEGYLYESPFIDVASLGAGFKPENLNRESSNVCVSSFYHNTFFDINSAGLSIDAGAIVQSAGGAVKSIAGEASSAVTEWVLARGKDYVFRFTNNNGSTALYNSNISLYEP